MSVPEHVGTYRGIPIVAVDGLDGGYIVGSGDQQAIVTTKAAVADLQQRYERGLLTGRELREFVEASTPQGNVLRAANADPIPFEQYDWQGKRIVNAVEPLLEDALEIDARRQRHEDLRIKKHLGGLSHAEAEELRTFEVGEEDEASRWRTRSRFRVEVDVFPLPRSPHTTDEAIRVQATITAGINTASHHVTIPAPALKVHPDPDALIRESVQSLTKQAFEEITRTATYAASLDGLGQTRPSADASTGQARTPDGTDT